MATFFTFLHEKKNYIFKRVLWQVANMSTFHKKGGFMSIVEWLQIFGNNLNEIMCEKGISRVELCSETGIDKGTLSRYINGQRMPTIKNVINICYVLDCDINDLMDFGDAIEW